MFLYSKGTQFGDVLPPSICIPVVINEDNAVGHYVRNRVEGLLDTEANFHSIQTQLNQFIESMTELRKKDNEAMENMHGEIAELRTENAELRTEVAELRTENAELRSGIAKLEEEVKKEKVQRINDVTLLTRKLHPLYRRRLLDLTQTHLAVFLEKKSWQQFRANKTDEEIVAICAQSPISLSEAAIKYLLSGESPIRKAGNLAAHSATNQEMRLAVDALPLDSSERGFLDEYYDFLQIPLDP
ncbi:hypothetical protein AX16_004944 [Volvariella volvacea WC 439]|nr:hypothetical protein AX16_004944 [Volvariella volvacea WC 439]